MPTYSGATRAERRALSAQRILAAARTEFAERGFEGATIRAIAHRAGVDPALVMQHHGSKEALFRSAARLDPTSGDVAAHLRDVIDSRIAGLPPELHALTRSMLTVQQATEAMRDYLDDRVTALAETTEGDDAQLRAALTVCALLGLTLGRHFLHLSALDQASDAELSDAAQAWFATAVGPADR